MRVEKVEEEEEQEEEEEGEEQGREGMNRADTEQRERERQREASTCERQTCRVPLSPVSLSVQGKIKFIVIGGRVHLPVSAAPEAYDETVGPAPFSIPSPNPNSPLSLSTHPPSLPAPVLFKYTRVYIYIWLNHYNKLACPLLTVSHPLIS